MPQHAFLRHSELLPWRLVSAFFRSNVAVLLLTLLALPISRAYCQAGTFPPAAVGDASALLTVPVSVSRPGALAEIRVVTQGIAELDFHLSTSGSCILGPLASGQTCAVGLTFKPTAPGLRQGAVLLLDSTGAELGRAVVSGTGLGSLAVFTPAMINTIVGNGRWLFTGDGALAVNSPVFLPGGVAVDPTGVLYVSDSGNNRVRVVRNGIIGTAAGNGTPGYGGDNGPASQASLSNPGALALDGAGDLYIADTANHVIRMLVHASQQIVTVAGTPSQQGYSGDGGPALSASLNTPEGVATDVQGNLYIADTGNCVIRKVAHDTKQITTVAGNGTCGFSGDGQAATSGQLHTPWGLAISVSGTIFIADLNNNRIRSVSPSGVLSTVMGDGTATLPFDGQSALSTSVNNPAAVTVDLAGNLYVADSGHNVVRKVNASTQISTVVAGDSSPTFGGDMSAATDAGLYGPYALAIDSNGNLYIADIFHHRIRELQVSQAALMYPPMRVGRTSASKQQGVENDGSLPLNWQAFNPDPNTTISAAMTTCAVGTPLLPNQACTLSLAFSPQTTGMTVSGHLQALSDAVDSPAVVTLTGEVDELEPTQTTIAASANPATFGSPLTLSAQVTGNGPQPNGTIRFFDAGTLLGSAQTDATGTAVLTTASLSVGSHSITANFTGDLSNSPSTSTPLIENVRYPASVTLISSANPANVGLTVIFSAAISAPGGSPTGSVTFYDGSTVLGSAALSASGTATLTTSFASSGTHPIKAAYSGDSNTLVATSDVLAENVTRWATQTTVRSSEATVTLGTSVTFTFTVAASGSQVPTGTITLTDNGAVVTSLSLDGAGTATYQTSSLAVGQHSLTAAYSGDSVNAPGTSSVLNQTITQVSTSTLLGTSANPTKGGATIHLTASVVAGTPPPIAGPITGTVIFLDGTSVLGSAPLSSSGQATLDVNSLAVGLHQLSASYTGNSNFGGSTASSLSEQVVFASSTTALSSTLNPTVVGRDLVLTAVVSGDGSIPTGSVTFLDGTTPLGSSTLSGAGQAVFEVTGLTAGTHALTASYSGDARANPSTSPVLSEQVDRATTSLTIASSSNPVIAGTSLTFLASLTSNGSLPPGNVVLYEGSQSLSVGSLRSDGTAQLTVPNLSAGTHVLYAAFAGDPSHSSAASSSLNQVVQLATASVQLSSSQNPALLGDQVIFTALVTGQGLTPTGNVVFSDGASILGEIPLSAAGTAAMNIASLSAGSHTISAHYLGDPTHSAADSAALAQGIQRSTSMRVSATPNPAIAGTSVTITATTAAPSINGLGGSVAISDGAQTLGTFQIGPGGLTTLNISSLSVGTHLITATYSGDTYDRGSTSQAFPLTISAANTSLELSSSANPSLATGPLTLVARLAGTGTPPTGSISFLDGSALMGTAPLANGSASFRPTGLSAGSHVLTAHYAGDGANQPSTSATILQVVQQSTSTNLSVSSNPLLTLQPLALLVTVNAATVATGNVSFFDDQTLLGTSPLDGNGQASLSVPALAARSHTLTARYQGDTYSVASASNSVLENVQLRDSHTVLTSSASTFSSGQEVTIVAVVQFVGPSTPTGTVTFLQGATPLATSTLSAAGAATFTLVPTLQTLNIVAVYNGDNSYRGSTSSSFTIAPGSSTTFSLSSNPPSFTLQRGDHKQLSISLTSTGSFDDSISLACLNLPSDATCTFTNNQLALHAGGVTGTQVVFDTGNPLGAGASAKADSGSRSQNALAALWLPAAMLLGGTLFVVRRRYTVPNLFAALLLVLCGTGLIGCGSSLQISQTPSGHYTVQVAARGMKSGVTQITNIDVEVK